MQRRQAITFRAIVAYALLISITDVSSRTLGALHPLPYALLALDFLLPALALLSASAPPPQRASALPTLHFRLAILRLVLAVAWFPAATRAQIDFQLRPETPLLVTLAVALFFLPELFPSEDGAAKASDAQKRDLASTAQDLLTCQTQSDALEIIGLGVGRLFPEASVALLAYHHFESKRRRSWTEMYDRINRGSALNTLRVLFPFEKTLKGPIPESIRSAVEYGDLLDSDDLGPDRYDDWPGLLETYGCSRIVMVPMGGFKGPTPRRACAVLVLLCGSSKSSASLPEPSSPLTPGPGWPTSKSPHLKQNRFWRFQTPFLSKLSKKRDFNDSVPFSGPGAAPALLDTDLLQEFARVAGAALYRFDLQFKVQMHHAALVDFLPELQSRSMTTSLAGGEPPFPPNTGGGGFGRRGRDSEEGLDTPSTSLAARQALLNPLSPAPAHPRAHLSSGDTETETAVGEGETSLEDAETSLHSALRPALPRIRTGMDEQNKSRSPNSLHNRYSGRFGQGRGRGGESDGTDRDSGGTGLQTPKSLRNIGGPNTRTWDTHDHVTMLFCDLVGYTSLAEKTSDLRILHILHAMYSGFDDLMERISEDKMMKLDVVGDAYIACGGLNWQKSVSRRESARTVLRFASEIVSRVAEFPLIPVGEGEDENVRVQIRIGVATGSVAAGLIGRIRKKYTCLGTTVNLAARLESNGRPMCIHVAEETAAVAGLDTSLLERQTLKVKGIAEPVTAYLWDPILQPGLVEQGIKSSFIIPSGSSPSHLIPDSAPAAAGGAAAAAQAASSAGLAFGPGPTYRRKDPAGLSSLKGQAGLTWIRTPSAQPLSSVTLQ